MRYKFSTKYDILLGYTVFIVSYFAIQAGIGQSFLTGEVPLAVAPKCQRGVLIIDGLINCAWQYLQPILVLFNLNSNVGLVNLIIIIPWLIFLFLIIIETIKP